MIRSWAVLMGVALLYAPQSVMAGPQPWPAWDMFRAQFISADGRVADPSTRRDQTTSEGQSYALFFALVDNDRHDFAKILQWTRDNLAAGDLGTHLPAWQWGQRGNGGWGVIDDNPAADADLWLAYTLSEAGRLWRMPSYTVLAHKLASNIMRQETIVFPKLGRVLLPAPHGFHPSHGLWRLNPSYMPIQLLRRMAFLYPDSGWDQVASSAVEIIVRASPRGFAPDWVIYKPGEGLQPDGASHAKGSYDAIRVYLWAGMLARDDPARRVLLHVLAPMARRVATTGIPPLSVDTRTGAATGDGPPGFSAALRPFLFASGFRKAAIAQGKRVAGAALKMRNHYYDQALSLFGQGWSQHRFRFARNGSVQPKWTWASDSSHSH